MRLIELAFSSFPSIFNLYRSDSKKNCQKKKIIIHLIFLPLNRIHKIVKKKKTKTFSCRYKNSMPDRYRDVASKCDRYLPPPHYLASGGPLVSTSGNITNNVVDSNSMNMYGNVVNRGFVGNTNNSIVTNSTDTYLSGYLSSTVHTPVKRYIPSTNTIATDIYSDSTVVLPHHQQVHPQIENDFALFYFIYFNFIRV